MSNKIKWKRDGARIEGFTAYDVRFLILCYSKDRFIVYPKVERYAKPITLEFKTELEAKNYYQDWLNNYLKERE